MLRDYITQTFPEHTIQSLSPLSTIGVMSTCFSVTLNNTSNHTLKLIAKTPLEDHSDTFYLTLHKNECHFYHLWSKLGQRDGTPNVYFPEGFSDDFEMPILMDDLRPAGPISIRDGIDFERTRMALCELGRIQCFIEKNTSCQDLEWLDVFLCDGGATIGFMVDTYPSGYGVLEMYLGGVKDIFDVDDERFVEMVDVMRFDSGLSVRQMLNDLKEYQFRLPYIFTHGDFQANNILYGADDKISIIDFQWVMKGPCFLDPIVLMFLSMQWRDREEMEVVLLKEYYNIVSSCMIESVSFEDLSEDIKHVKLFCYLQLLCSMDLFEQHLKKGKDTTDLIARQIIEEIYLQ
eukprot:TRINITY_DN8502_c0_g1_i1.p1 TRINITY_DN8502_c0_g1~~TRINITY_DN8502_c0_g1_i1.p1  ORF type:complete len:347 (+),score=70.19 TRINITY_DN8502_c0_g1_i1:34-1074(+)